MANGFNYARSSKEVAASRNGRAVSNHYETIAILRDDTKQRNRDRRERELKFIATVKAMPKDDRKKINSIFKLARSQADELANLSYGAWLLVHLPELIDGLSLSGTSSLPQADSPGR